MSCRSCSPSKFSPEHTKKMKPENHSGCGVKAENNCQTASDAPVGSPLYEWEQEHGRLIYVSEIVLGDDGRWTRTYKKVPCPVKPKKTKRRTCCSLKYRLTR